MTQHELPSTMKSLAIEKYCKPDEYQILDLPVPKISGPDDVIIKVTAASINPIDVKVASGMAKMIWPQTFPHKIGYDVSGIIVDISPETLALHPDLKHGTEVFSRVPEHCHGTVSEYALSTVSATFPIPRTLSHIEAASIPLASLTSLQTLDRADATLVGGLKGKTVFIPGGLAGTSSMAIQLAKNVFGVGKVITTVSTAKVSKVEELLEKNVVDQIIDYTKEDPATVIPSGSVDFMFDTMGQATTYLKILKKGSVIVSVSGVPFGPDLKKRTPDLPFYVGGLLNFLGGITRFRTWWHGASYSYLFMQPKASDLARLSQWIDDGKLKPVVGRVANFDNLQEVRAGCQEVYSGKGGIGKFVIENPTTDFFRKTGIGFASGTLASIANIPFDVAKSRIQGPQPVAGEVKYKTCMKTIVTVAREEGFGALYKGLVPKVMRLGPGGAIMLIVYEYVYDLLQAIDYFAPPTN